MLELIMKKVLAGDLFGVLSFVRVCLLTAGVLTASACQSESKMLSAPVTGYNHTSAAINQFSVNGAGGPNLGPHQGGGKQSCCGVVPRHWVPGLRAIVEWEKDPDPYAYGKWPERPYSDAWRKRMAEHKKTTHVTRRLWKFQGTIFQVY